MNVGDVNSLSSPVAVDHAVLAESEVADVVGHGVYGFNRRKGRATTKLHASLLQQGVINNAKVKKMMQRPADRKI